MVTFQKFVNLIEAKQEETGEHKLAVFAFGRFNPPTKGHQKLVNTVATVAENRGGTPFIFPSTTHDPKKNPLPYQDKVTLMRELFPEANIVGNPEIKNPFQAAGFLNSEGYTDLVFVVGSDRVDEFRTRFNKANEYFDSFEIVSAGERDPDADGVVGMSGTKAREAAVEGNVGKFRATTGWEGEIVNRMMAAIRAGMGVK